MSKESHHSCCPGRPRRRRVGLARHASGGDPDIIRLSGNIELTEVDLSFKLPGRLIELAVREGDDVKPGQTIARMDSNELKQQQAREGAGVESAESALVQLRSAIAWQSETIGGDIALKTAELAVAEARLLELQNGSRPQEIETSRALAAEAEVQNSQAQQLGARSAALQERRHLHSAVRSFRTKAEAAAAALRRTRQQLKLVEEGPRREQVQQQRAAVDRARAAVRLAETNKLDLKRRRDELPMRQARRTRQARPACWTCRYDRTLVAPIAGVVMAKRGDGRGDRRRGHGGDVGEIDNLGARLRE